MKEPYVPGELDQRIAIVRETRTDDGMGGVTTTDSTVATVWAHARPRGASEGTSADRREGKAMYLFVVRKRAVRDTDIIQWDGVKYNIRGILTKGGRAKYLEIEAERGVAI